MWYYLSLWILQGVVGYGMHYISFFYLIMYEDCLAASVSKASQSALIFFLSSVFFCEHSPSQCLSEIKIIAAIVVFFSVIMVRFFLVIVVKVIVNGFFAYLLIAGWGGYHSISFFFFPKKFSWPYRGYSC